MSDYKTDEGPLLTDRPVQQQQVGVVRRRSIVTQTLIALNVLVYVAMVVKGVSAISPSGEDLIPWGADYGPLTLGAGQWWRMLTACFLHFGIIHIGFNMYVLYQVGMFTELLYGRQKYLLLYIMSGIGGNLLSLWVHPMSVAAGASGAIFGVYGGLLGFLLVQRNRFPQQAAAQIAKSAIIFLGINLVYGLTSGTTDLSAHIGGLFTGFLLGCFLAHGHPTVRSA